MAGGGTREERAAEVSAIASRLFGNHVPTRPLYVVRQILDQG